MRFPSPLGYLGRYHARILMRFSLLSLMGIMSAASVSAALSRLEFGIACLVLVGLIALSIFIVPRIAWRYCVYCGIAGVATGIILMLLWMFMTEGRISSRTRADTGPLIAIVENWRPWIMSCGSLIGGTAGFLLYQYQKQTPVNIDSHEKPG